MEGAIVNAIAAGCSDDGAVMAAEIFTRLDKSNAGVRETANLRSFVTRGEQKPNPTRRVCLAGHPDRCPGGTESVGPGALYALRASTPAVPPHSLCVSNVTQPGGQLSEGPRRDGRGRCLSPG